MELVIGIILGVLKMITKCGQRNYLGSDAVLPVAYEIVKQTQLSYSQIHNIGEILPQFSNNVYLNHLGANIPQKPRTVSVADAIVLADANNGYSNTPNPNTVHQNIVARLFETSYMRNTSSQISCEKFV